MGEFDSLSRKPDGRHDFLVKHGWPADKCSKRKVDAQRDFLLDALCNGSIGRVEGQMFLDCCVLGPCRRHCFLRVIRGWGGWVGGGGGELQHPTKSVRKMLAVNGLKRNSPLGCASE